MWGRALGPSHPVESDGCCCCLQAYLVGDPIQLPATVLSKRATTFGYDVSLFKRLQSAGYPVQVSSAPLQTVPASCLSDSYYMS